MEPEFLYYGTEQMKAAVPEETTIFGINIHLIMNILLFALMFILWKGNRKIQKEIKEDQPWEYYQLIWKLKHLMADGTSEYDIFVIAAKEGGHAEYKVKDDFDVYLQSDARKFPVYVQKFLDAGRETIMKTKEKNKWLTILRGP